MDEQSHVMIAEAMHVAKWVFILGVWTVVGLVTLRAWCMAQGR